MKKAIVFDNSGTLVKRHRVIKDINNNKFITDINSMDIIDGTTSLALVVLQFDTNNLLKIPKNTLISEVIKRCNIDFDVSFTNAKLTKDEVKQILFNEKNATIADIIDAFPLLKDKVPKFELCNGSALIINMDLSTIEYTITSAGMLFSGVIDTIKVLKSRGIEIYIASGDRKGAIHKLADIIETKRENAFGSVSPIGKWEIVHDLQKDGYKVMMVGDAINDLIAFNQADVSVLTIEQEEEISPKMLDKSDYVINHISEIVNIDF
ncbi:HAD family hydrolase [Methanobrevibacter oralis]|uniref:HAD family hydrolase n=1 Tax=Methanobrevibacter oralis TaxID=66851 RepID=UPI001C73A49F|nr:HAD family hydrolase [Methanobrevibacter oralis]